MSTNIGTLTIEMAANIVRLQQDMDKANRVVGRAMGDIQKAARAAHGALGLIGVGLSGAGVVAFTKSVIDGLDHLNDLSKTTGLAVEQLGGLGVMARKSGGDLDSIASSINKLSVNMGKDGEKFRALGITARDPIERFKQLSDVFVSIKDPAQRAAVMAAALGKSWEGAAPALALGGVELGKIIEEGTKSAGVTQEMAERADELNDKLEDMKSQISGAAAGIMDDLHPALSKLVEMTGNAAKELGLIFGASSEDTKIGDRLREIGELTTSALKVQKLFNLIGMQPPEGASNSYINKLNEEALALKKRLEEIRKIEEAPAKTEPPKGPSEADIKKFLGDEEAAKKAAALNEASRKYLETLRTETLAVGATTVQTKMLSAAKQAAITPSKELALAIMTEAKAWGKLAQFQEDAKEEFAVLEQREDAFREASNGVLDYARATDDANAAAQFEIELMGKSGVARDVAIAQRQAELVLKQKLLAITDQVSNADDRAALIEEANAISARAIAAAKLQAAAKSTAEEWARIGQTIEQTGKMAFTQFAAHGVSAMESIGEAIKLSIIDLIYQLTVRKWTIQLVTTVTNSLTSGFAEAAGSALGKMGGISGSVSGASNSFNLMNIASGVQSVFSAFTGGASSLVTAIGTSAVGQALGLGAAGGSALGAGVGIGGVGAGAGAGTAFIGGAGTALGGTGATVAGLSGMGSMLAAAAGPLAIAAAADAIFRLIAGDKTIKGAEALTYVPVIGPLINALFGMGPKKLGPSELTGQFNNQGFDGEFQADWKRKGGIFSFGKKKGRRGLGISAEQDAALDAMVGDISSAFFELAGVTGDAERSLQGWTFEVKRQIQTEEQQEALTKDLAKSIGTFLIPELTLIQKKGEELSETAARASAEFSLMSATIDLTGQSFGKIGLASLGLRDSLVQLLGGIENAGSALQPFFEGFYTEAERVASTGRLMNAELAKLGITTVPTTREQFRALVEAQDLSTSSGQKMFAALIQLAPAFLTVTDAIGKAADDAAAEAKRIADSIQLLTTDAFATLFDYTKYIRLAANAGVTAAQPEGPVYQAPGQVFLPGFAVGSNDIPHDMTARIHKGERIIPAADNRELMRRLSDPGAANDALVSEIKQLRSELRAAHQAMAMNTSRTARSAEKLLSLNEEWDISGQPPERTA